jgi:hypothetical protein
MMAARIEAGLTSTWEGEDVPVTLSRELAKEAMQVLLAQANTIDRLERDLQQRNFEEIEE